MTPTIGVLALSFYQTTFREARMLKLSPDAVLDHQILKLLLHESVLLPKKDLIDRDESQLSEQEFNTLNFELADTWESTLLKWHADKQKVILRDIIDVDFADFENLRTWIKSARLGVLLKHRLARIRIDFNPQGLAEDSRANVLVSEQSEGELSYLSWVALKDLAIDILGEKIDAPQATSKLLDIMLELQSKFSNNGYHIQDWSMPHPFKESITERVLRELSEFFP